MAHGAHAIAHLDDGLVVFVENACPGDTVQAHIYDHRRSFAYAEIDSVIKPSELRMVDPPCKLHKVCGGCQWQHISYDEQLEFKRQNVIDFVRKSALTMPRPPHMLVAPVIGMDDPWRYRNKITYPVETVNASSGVMRREGTTEIGLAQGICERGSGVDLSVNEHAERANELNRLTPIYNTEISQLSKSHNGHRLLAGYYKRNTHELVNVKYCPVQYQIFDAIVEDVKELCSQKFIGKPLLRHINLRANQDQSQVLLTLIVRGRELAKPEHSATEERLREIFTVLMAKYPQLKGCCLNYNDASTNVIFGDKTVVLSGTGIIEDKLGDISFKISPSSFYQINTQQFAKIIDVVKAQIQTLIDTEELSPVGAEVLDAYAGIGTIALSLAAEYPLMQITAIEVIDAAVRNGIANAELNRINTVNFKTGEVEDHIEEFVARAQFSRDKRALDLVLVNPPRKGCTNKVLDSLGKIAAPNIIYVSCNPATLTRDIKYLEDYGYQVQEIQPVDMFPHTYHVEAVALLKKI